MRSTLSLLLLWICLLPCRAQKKSATGIYITGLRQNTAYTIPQLEPLLLSANAYYGSLLGKPFSQPVFGSSYQWGLGFLATAVGFDVSFGKQSAASEAVFTNGEKYELLLGTRETEVEFNFFAPLGFAGRLGVFMGFNKNKGLLKIGYRYADGDLSYGTEKPLTGIYRFGSFPLTGGFKLMLGYKWVNVYFKAGFSGLFQKFTGYGLGIKDNVGNGSSIYSNRQLRVYLPQDFYGQFNPTLTGSGTTPLVEPGLHGWKFQYGISFLLAKFNDKNK